MITFRRFPRALPLPSARRVVSGIKTSAAVLGCALALQAPSWAQRPVRVTLPDVPVVDEDGRQLRFFTDLVKGDKTVLINFVYTRCTAVCPQTGQKIKDLKDVLKELVQIVNPRGPGKKRELGEDLFLITVSLDPEYDTPQRMKQWASRYGYRQREGWTLVSGSRASINEILRACKVSVQPRVVHSSEWLIGNDANGKWRREYGFSERFVKIIENVNRVGP